MKNWSRSVAIIAGAVIVCFSLVYDQDKGVLIGGLVMLLAILFMDDK